jgi:hypothetical protein
MPFATGLTPAQVLANLESALINLRNDLARVGEIYAWTQGLVTADMETAAGLGAADANTVLSAYADANALLSYYSIGLPPAAYPQPVSAYPYGATQRQVIGSQ